MGNQTRNGLGRLGKRCNHRCTYLEIHLFACYNLCMACVNRTFIRPNERITGNGPVSVAFYFKVSGHGETWNGKEIRGFDLQFEQAWNVVRRDEGGSTRNKPLTLCRQMRRRWWDQRKPGRSGAWTAGTLRAVDCCLGEAEVKTRFVVKVFPVQDGSILVVLQFKYYNVYKATVGWALDTPDDFSSDARL